MRVGSEAQIVGPHDLPGLVRHRLLQLFPSVEAIAAAWDGPEGAGSLSITRDPPDPDPIFDDDPADAEHFTIEAVLGGMLVSADYYFRDNVGLGELVDERVEAIELSTVVRVEVLRNTGIVAYKRMGEECETGIRPDTARAVIRARG